MKRFLAVTVLAGLAFIALPLEAQAPAGASRSLAGQPIERFEVVGNTSVASDTIRVYLGIVPGDPYDPVMIQTNFANLWQTGLFDDIRIGAEQGDSGVVVRVSVVERPRIGAVEYRGNKELNTSKIVEALERDKINLHVGSTIEQTLVRRAAESIRKAYAEAGFEGVVIEPRTEQMTLPAERRVVFDIREGVKARVAGIDFTGNRRFSDRRLRSVMKDVKKHNIVTWIRKKNVYTPSKLQEDLERVRDHYLDYGYKDVSFGDPRVETVGRSKRGRVRLSIPVVEGDVHTFGSVSIGGNSVYTDEQIIGNWPLKSGEVLRRRPVQNRIEAFQELYSRQGYIYAFINPEYEDRENNVVDVRIEVFEGEQFRLGRLEFQGNTTTKDKVLRREIFLDEGDIMDMETFKASMFKLGQLGYFKITENPDFKVNPESKTVDIVVKGLEEGRNDIQFGGGYSETYGFFGQFQFSTRNFMGEGDSIGVSFQRGRRQDFFSLSYADPWFMDRPHSFGISVFNRNTVFPQVVGFESRGQGGTLAYGYRVDRFESISFLYGLQKVEENTEFVPLPDDEGNIPLPAISNTEFTSSTFVPAYRFDSRDNPYDTSRGMRTALSVAYSGGPLGGTINIFKPEINFTLYHRLSRRTTLSFNVEAGQIFPQEKDCANLFADLQQFENQLCVPRSERYFVGGEQSVRGFQSYTLGPLEELNGFDSRVGGYKKAIFNAEYVIRVNDPLRFVLFADAGNAFGYHEDWDFSRLRYSTGAELRIFLPVFQFPLRFIYAVNPDRQPGDQFQSFQFSIGNTF
ncbi:MAG TPA: outer membrane protein assembly factor BamA [Thermoanaerobaculia bacterium]|nr:outer membrane protein assembly factor BamA [Thermoanaerobaculia bacterium]